MSLTTQVISGSTQALNLIKNYLANPFLALPIVGINDVPTVDPGSQVVILGASFHEIGDDDVSSQLIVNATSGGKAWITDNIAPKPRMWELSGYIGPTPGMTILNVVNGVFIGELASPMLQDDLAKSRNKLRAMRTSRQALVFGTPNGEELVFVAIKHLDFEKQPLVQNQIPVTMTIQEIPIANFTPSTGIGIPSGTSNPAADPVTLGVSNALGVTNFSAVLGGFI